MPSRYRIVRLSECQFHERRRVGGKIVDGYDGVFVFVMTGNDTADWRVGRVLLDGHNFLLLGQRLGAAIGNIDIEAHQHHGNHGVEPDDGHQIENRLLAEDFNGLCVGGVIQFALSG